MKQIELFAPPSTNYRDQLKAFLSQKHLLHYALEGCECRRRGSAESRRNGEQKTGKLYSFYYLKQLKLLLPGLEFPEMYTASIMRAVNMPDRWFLEVCAGCKLGLCRKRLGAEYVLASDVLRALKGYL